MRTRLLTTSALVLAATLAFPVLAASEPNESPLQYPGATSSQPGMMRTQPDLMASPPVTLEQQARIPTEQFLGMKVQSSQGKDVGKIADLIVNKDTGAIDRVVVSYGGFLGIGEKKVAVPWSELTVDPARNTARVAMTEEQLKTAPEFEYTDRDTSVVREGEKSRK
ncbi:MAG: PRC-barrel domain-containing protein [Alphaproteobacteria bacterium]